MTHASTAWQQLTWNQDTGIALQTEGDGRTGGDGHARPRAPVAGAVWPLTSPRAAAAKPPGLDYSTESQTANPPEKRHRSRGVRSLASIHSVARIYPGGELTVSKLMRHSASPTPAPRYGPRMTRGLTAEGGRKVRRAIFARAQQGRCQWVLLTLTSAMLRTDEEMREHLERFLDWGRTRLGQWFAWYVIVPELQARGVLHFHMLVCKRMPRRAFDRVNAMWASYGMGDNAIDWERMRHGAKAAAGYLSKYVVKRPNAHTISLDCDGFLSFSPWMVSRHTGEVYQRVTFRGNSYQMSDLARAGTKHVTEFTAPLGTFEGLDGYHGCKRFFDSPQDAHDALTAAIGSGVESNVGPPPRGPK